MLQVLQVQVLQVQVLDPLREHALVAIATPPPPWKGLPVMPVLPVGQIVGFDPPLSVVLD